VDAAASTARGRSSPTTRVKSLSSGASTTATGVKQLVDRGVGPTPAPPHSPAGDHHQLPAPPLYFGAAVSPYLRDPRHAGLVDPNLGLFHHPLSLSLSLNSVTATPVELCSYGEAVQCVHGTLCVCLIVLLCVCVVPRPCTIDFIHLWSI